jgi:hypothetical protein
VAPSSFDRACLNEAERAESKAQDDISFDRACLNEAERAESKGSG